MTNVFVIIHVLAAVLFMGPVTVAVSLFPRQARTLHDTPEQGSAKIVQFLHRLTKIYGFLSLLVPLFGIAAFVTVDGAMSQWPLHVAIALTLIAWAILFFAIIPAQRTTMLALGLTDSDDTPPNEKDIEKARNLDWQKSTSRQSMFGGIFNLLWIVSAVLMFFVQS